MKLWKAVSVVSVAVFLMSAVGLAVCRIENAGGGNTAKEQNDSVEIITGDKSPPASCQEELCDRLNGFAEILYQYDTEERKFYEGAETYMTDKAFQMLRPPDFAEEAKGGKVRIRSFLVSTDIYAYYSSEVNAEVIMESRFTLSQAANGSVTQYLKLSMEKKDGQWIITDCHVIDTLEE